MPIDKKTMLPIISMGLNIGDINNAIIVPMAQIIPKMVNITEPIKSCFQEIIKRRIKINEGML